MLSPTCTSNLLISRTLSLKKVAALFNAATVLKKSLLSKFIAHLINIFMQWLSVILWFCAKMVLKMILLFNFVVVVVCFARRMDAIHTIYGSFQLTLVLFCTYFIIFLRGLVQCLSRILRITMTQFFFYVCVYMKCLVDLKRSTH